MEIYCYGTARVRHAVTGEVYSIAADELDWQDAGGDERPMGPAFHHEAMVEHPELGLMSWGVWEYPEGAENMTESNVGQHILVEDFSITSIRQAREQYLQGPLRSGLAKHHADPDSAFFGWNDIWLAPAFARWNITTSLPYIRCPVLAIQGVDDVYGTMAQIDGIAAALPGTRLLKLPACGHSPHRDQPAAVIAACQGFLAGTPLSEETTR